ncbi:MAG TPA: FAD binding domain-containing protein, partial [Bryobacteraceae bacterium]|nr:FAD binding domain-containing protein [Bryobacteraceae bacterium]
FAEQYRPERSGACDPDALGGNLCRCTGYRPIRDAVAAVGPPAPGYFLDRLAKPAPTLRALDYFADRARLERPGNLAECLSSLSRYPKAKVISGGTDLVVESNLHFRRWSHLISLEGIEALREFGDKPDAVRIGAGLPLGEIGRLWTDAPASVSEWLELFGSPQIRNRATLGGNLATASPIGDSAPLLLALNANLQAISIRGSRTLPLASFFTGYRTTTLEPDELIRAIEIPKPFPMFTRFYKASKRRMDDISTVAAGLSIDLDANGTIKRAVFAFGGVAASPLRVAAAEEVAQGKPWSPETVEVIGQELDRVLSPIDDHRGSAAYRKAMARNFVAKFYQEWAEADA